MPVQLNVRDRGFGGTERIAAQLFGEQGIFEAQG